MSFPTNEQIKSLGRRRAKQALMHRAVRLPLLRYRHRGLTPSDTFLATYPRSGTTWVRFMLFELLQKDSADFFAVGDAIPYIGRHLAAPPILPGGGRLIQTHERFCDDERRIALIVRDPRSVAVSNYYYQKRRRRTGGRSLDEFVIDWVKGRATPFGDWGAHTEFWLRQAPGKLHVTRYEDLREAPQPALQALADFLAIPAGPSDMAAAIENNSFQAMRQKEDTRSRMAATSDPQLRFVRSGSSSGWQQELSAHSQRLITSAFKSTMEKTCYRLTDV